MSDLSLNLEQSLALANNGTKRATIRAIGAVSVATLVMKQTTFVQLDELDVLDQMVEFLQDTLAEVREKAGG